MTQINLLRQVKNLNFPEGFLINGKIVTSVNAGNLTVAIKTLAGTDPTVYNPIHCRIDGVVRTITSALSFTANAGTNYLNLGSAELSTKEVDLFIYFVYDATLASVGILSSRIPYATKWSDFSTTGTNEKSFNCSSNVNPASTDVVVNIGRFNAILSAGPSYTWSLPDTSVIINRPCFETRYLDFLPIVSGSNGGSGVDIATEGKYKLISNEPFIQIRVSVIDKGSLSGVIQISTPFGVSNNLSEIPLNGFYSNYGNNPTPGLGVPVLNTGNNCISILVGVDTGAATFEDLTGTPRIRIKDSYNI